MVAATVKSIAERGRAGNGMRGARGGKVVGHGYYIRGFLSLFKKIQFF
jgi:hypothetical protein